MPLTVDYSSGSVNWWKQLIESPPDHILAVAGLDEPLSIEDVACRLHARGSSSSPWSAVSGT
jgi:hypothetical protein